MDHIAFFLDHADVEDFSDRADFRDFPLEEASKPVLFIDQNVLLQFPECDPHGPGTAIQHLGEFAFGRKAVAYPDIPAGDIIEYFQPDLVVFQLFEILFHKSVHIRCISVI